MATLNLGRIKPVFRGAYAGGTAYVVDDIVTSGNETFICILASTGNATSNATYWTKLAAKGTDGTDGTDVGTTITTEGDILYRDGSGLQRLAKGTAAQVLKMNSGATAPEWGTDVGGKIQQVTSTLSSTARTFNTGGFGTLTDLTDFDACAITPVKAGSKILIQYSFCLGSTTDYGGLRMQGDIDGAGYNYIGETTRGSRTTSIIGNHYLYSDASRHMPFAGQYLWTPTYTLTDVITIKFRISANNTCGLNRSVTDTDNSAYFSGNSTVTLWEIN